jgi:hypothetical protein
VRQAINPFLPEAFITSDRNLSFQQNVRRLDIAVVVMTARTNRLIDLRRLVPALLKLLPFLKKAKSEKSAFKSSLLAIQRRHHLPTALPVGG